MSSKFDFACQVEMDAFCSLNFGFLTGCGLDFAIWERFTPPDPNSQYGYIPTEWICITFVVLFSVSAGT